VESKILLKQISKVFFVSFFFHNNENELNNNFLLIVTKVMNKFIDLIFFYFICG